jgi:hypothetical protein
MSRAVYFITHADVRIDPAVPVPRWGLSARGRARHEVFCTRALVAGITADQPGRNGGNYLAFARDGWALLHGWRDIAAEPPRAGWKTRRGRARIRR